MTYVTAISVTKQKVNEAKARLKTPQQISHLRATKQRVNEAEARLKTPQHIATYISRHIWQNTQTIHKHFRIYYFHILPYNTFDVNFDFSN